MLGIPCTIRQQLLAPSSVTVFVEITWSWDRSAVGGRIIKRCSTPPPPPLSPGEEKKENKKRNILHSRSVWVPRLTLTNPPRRNSTRFCTPLHRSRGRQESGLYHHVSSKTNVWRKVRIHVFDIFEAICFTGIKLVDFKLFSSCSVNVLVVSLK